jgi:WD40 repeat protein
MGGIEGSTRIWDLDPTSSAAILAFSAHDGEVFDAIYSADGTRMASTGMDSELKVWDSASGEMLLSLPGPLDEIFFPAFSPDGKRLAAANRKGGVSIWDAGSGAELLSLRGSKADYAPVAFSPDGTQLAAAGKDGAATIWDTATGERLASFQNSSGITRMIYTPGGEHIWTYDQEGNANSWSAVSGSELPIGSHETLRHVVYASLWDAELSQDGRLWATAASDGRIRVYATDDDPEEKPYYSNLHFLQNHTDQVAGIALDPGGSLMASASFDGTVRLWDLGNGQELITLVDHSLPMKSVDFSPDGKKLLAAGADGKVSEFFLSIEDLMQIARSRLSRGFTQEECQTYLHLELCPDE